MNPSGPGRLSTVLSDPVVTLLFSLNAVINFMDVENFHVVKSLFSVGLMTVSFFCLRRPAPPQDREDFSLRCSDNFTNLVLHIRNCNPMAVCMWRERGAVV